MHPHKRHLAASLVGILGLTAGHSALAQSSSALPAMETVHATTGGISRWVTLPGTIKAQQEATLYAKVPGYLKSINVDKGDTIGANATIAVLETPELEADVIRYRAEVAVAKAELVRLTTAVAQAPDLVVPAEMDRAKGRFDIANANLQRTQSLMGFGRVTAPFAGVITRRFVDPGAFIPAASSGGSPQNAAIVTLMNFSTVRVQVAMPEAEAGLVKKGQPVRFSVEGLAGRKFESTVARYAYALDESSKTMMVEAEVRNTDLALRPGMYASVQVALERREKVMLVPVAALLMEKANGFVFLAVDGIARKRAIKMGFNDGANVQVIEGITLQDSVVLPGKKALTDGQKIAAAGAK